MQLEDFIEGEVININEKIGCGKKDKYVLEEVKLLVNLILRDLLDILKYESVKGKMYCRQNFKDGFWSFLFFGYFIK